MAVQDWALSVFKVMNELHYVSVKDAAFAAAGNGVQDDSEAVQRALDGYGRIFFPPGEYRLRDIKIDGSNKEILAPPGTTLKVELPRSDNGA